MKALRLLHVSDIHFGQEDKHGNVHVHKDVRSEIERDCKRLRDKIGVADGIIVTGDIAYRGVWPEYELAMAWLDSLCDTIGCERDSVLVVPGNHDVDLSKMRGVSRLTQNQLRACKPEEIEDLLNEVNQTPSEAHPFGPKHSAYMRLAEAYKCDFQLKSPSWTKYFELDNGFRLKFVGLNTVQVSDLRDRPGDLVLGASQYVFTREDNVEQVVLMHHPPHWLKDQSTFDDYCKSRVRVLISGHEHKPAITHAKTGERFEQLHINSGATNPPIFENGYGFSYNWLEFSFGKSYQCGSHHLQVKLLPRIWNASTTSFGPDTARIQLTHLENEAAILIIECPDLKASATCEDVSDTVETVSSPRESAERIVEDGNLTPVGEDRRFKRLQYYFWRYTKPSDRLKILVDLALIQPSTSIDFLPQDFEMTLLKNAREQRKLRALWDKVMPLLPLEQQTENPFSEGE